MICLSSAAVGSCFEFPRMRVIAWNDVNFHVSRSDLNPQRRYFIVSTKIDEWIRCGWQLEVSNLPHPRSRFVFSQPPPPSHGVRAGRLSHTSRCLAWWPCLFATRRHIHALQTHGGRVCFDPSYTRCYFLPAHPHQARCLRATPVTDPTHSIRHMNCISGVSLFGCGGGMYQHFT